MMETKIRLIIFFAAKDGEALYGPQKQDQELTLAQIIKMQFLKSAGVYLVEERLNETVLFDRALEG